MRWVWRFYILREEYGQEEKLYLLRKHKMSYKKNEKLRVKGKNDKRERKTEENYIKKRGEMP